MNFVLPSSRVKESGLEVACKGQVVRLELPPGADNQTSLAVEIKDYRLFPFIPGRSNLDDPFGAPETGE